MNNLEIHITKSWRKSISMSFDKNGVLQVKAPKFLTSLQIDSFIEKNQSWIEKHYSKLREREENKKYYVLGKELETSLPGIPTLYTKSRGLQNGASFSSSEESTLAFAGTDPEFKREILKYYKSRAKNYIIPRCHELAEKHGFHYEGIRITSAATRWGSCSSKKTLNFSYRLIMSPPECIDYVIIHELCHLRQMNHSAKFWKEVAAIMPEYKKYEKHLKSEGWKYAL